MTYRPVASDFGHMLSASVVFEGTGQAIPPYSLIGERLVAAGTLASTPVPTLPTTVRAGQTVAVTPGVWDPGTELSYVWKVDGVAIDGQTEASLTVPYSAYNKNLTVSVTGTRASYTSVTKTSVARKVTAATMTLTPTPVITGTAKFGQTLGITEGTWDAGVSIAYAWKRGGVAIAQATSSEYTLTTADVGKAITVSLTASKLGYASVTKTSVAVTPTLATFEVSPVPTVAGVSRVGGRLDASTGTWPDGTTLRYQWKRGTTVITGATGTSYTLTAADYNTDVKFVVTATKTGYATLSRESSVTRVLLGQFEQVPTISFASAPAYLSAVAPALGTWDAGVTKTYSWKLDGVAIAGATAASYTPLRAHVGRTLQFVVTASKSGYESVTVRTAATTVTLASFATPTFTKPRGITNYLKDGSLTNYCSTANISWTVSNPAGATLSYQWYKNGTAIRYATNANYQLDELPGADSTYFLEVAFIKDGYTTAAFNSAEWGIASACPGR